MASPNGKGLILAIIFASVIVSSSLTFFGMKLFGNGISEKDLETNIQKGIDTYVQNLQQKYDEQAEADNKPQEVSGDFADDDAFLGDDDAPVTIVEFSDYECPYCHSFYDETFAKLKTNYIETGKVKFVYRDYPLSKHAAAYPAALISECARDQAGDEGYFKMHDWLFENIDSGFDATATIAYAKTLDVDGEELQECIDSEKFKDEIFKDMDDGLAAGVNGTPGFVVNNKVFAGARPYEYFAQIIEEELKAE